MNTNHNFSTEVVAGQLAGILADPFKEFGSERDAMRFSLGILDLTTLEGADTKQKVEALCRKAVSFSEKGLPNVAAVCVYPVFARQVHTLLEGTGIQTACVAGAFPAGQSPIHVKLAEVKYAVEEGADEIDMVISRGKLLEGEYIEVFDEINAIKEVCGNVHLKVILETGELTDLPRIYDASVIAMKAGGDFIKTSTGKINPAATPEAAYVMLQAIRDYYESTGKITGFKPAGGISTPEQALVYVRLVESILGPEWLNPGLFRIGASRLADNLANELSGK
jgi:deoxyribose-phosphate aldolase